MIQWCPDETHYRSWQPLNKRWRGLLKDVTAPTLKTALILTQRVWFVKHAENEHILFSTWFTEVLEMMRYRPEFNVASIVKPFEVHLLEFFLVECSFHVMAALLNMCGRFNDDLANVLETSYFMPLMSLYIAKRDNAKRLVGGLHFETLSHMKLNSEGAPETSSYTWCDGMVKFTCGSHYPVPKPCKDDWQTHPVPWDADFEDPKSQQCEQRLHRDTGFMQLSKDAFHFSAFIDVSEHQQDWLVFRAFVHAWLRGGFHNMICVQFGMQSRDVRVLMDVYDAKVVTATLDRLSEFREAWSAKWTDETRRTAELKSAALDKDFKAWLQDCRLMIDGDVKDAVPLKWVDFKEVVRQRFALADDVLDTFLKKFNLREHLKKLNKSQKRKRGEDVPVIRAVFEGDAAVFFRDDKKQSWSLL